MRVPDTSHDVPMDSFARFPPPCKVRAGERSFVTTSNEE
jgi:hypothetical protein